MKLNDSKWASSDFARIAKPIACQIVDKTCDVPKDGDDGDKAAEHVGKAVGGIVEGVESLELEPLTSGLVFEEGSDEFEGSDGKSSDRFDLAEEVAGDA